MIVILGDTKRLDAGILRRQRQSERIAEARARARRVFIHRKRLQFVRALRLRDMGFSQAVAIEAVLTKEERVQRLVDHGISVEVAEAMVVANEDGGINRALVTAWLENQHSEIKRHGNRLSGRKRRKAKGTGQSPVLDGRSTYLSSGARRQLGLRPAS